MDKSNALTNLVEAHSITSSIGMYCWLTDGTLLGFYRDGNFIAHDSDLDLGCNIADYKPEVFDAFFEKGWTCRYVFGKRDCGLEISFVKNDIKLDIFFFYNENGRLWHGAWRRVDKKTRNLIKYYYDKFALSEAEFLGEKFMVPEDTEKYVSTKYGKGWRTPVKDWDWAFGPSNAVETDINMPRPKKPYTAKSVQ